MDYVFEFEGLEFEWDTSKALSNYRKHDVTFEVAAQVFLDPFHSIFKFSGREYSSHHGIRVSAKS
jgi:uncharacterized DUF497 family protein